MTIPIVAPMLRAATAQLAITAAGDVAAAPAACAAAALRRARARAAATVAAPAATCRPAPAALAAARLRGTRPSGKGLRESASSAWAVTHTGVCVELRE